MTPEQIAERLVAARKHPARDEWTIVLESANGRAAIQIGPPTPDREFAESYSDLLRGVLAEIVREVLEEKRG